MWFVLGAREDSNYYEVVIEKKFYANAHKDRTLNRSRKNRDGNNKEEEEEGKRRRLKAEERAAGR